jgi:hypothetical protein
MKGARFNAKPASPSCLIPRGNEDGAGSEPPASFAFHICRTFIRAMKKALTTECVKSTEKNRHLTPRVFLAKDAKETKKTFAAFASFARQTPRLADLPFHTQSEKTNAEDRWETFPKTAA